MIERYFNWSLFTSNRGLPRQLVTAVGGVHTKTDDSIVLACSTHLERIIFKEYVSSSRDNIFCQHWRTCRICSTCFQKIHMQTMQVLMQNSSISISLSIVSLMLSVSSICHTVLPFTFLHELIGFFKEFHPLGRRKSGVLLSAISVSIQYPGRASLVDLSTCAAFRTTKVIGHFQTFTNSRFCLSVCVSRTGTIFLFCARDPLPTFTWINAHGHNEAQQDTGHMQGCSRYVKAARSMVGTLWGTTSLATVDTDTCEATGTPAVSESS